MTTNLWGKMKKSLLLILTAGMMVCLCSIPGRVMAQSKTESQKTNKHMPPRGPVKVDFTTSVIKGYGDDHYFPDAAIQPDPNMDYKVVFLITKNDAKADINFGLEHMARLINLLHDAGVKQDHIHLIGVMTGPATAVALRDSTYKKMFTVTNPNDTLLTELTTAGHAELYVCAQALSGMGYGASYLNPNVKMALSALTTVTTYELKGYALMQF